MPRKKIIGWCTVEGCDRPLKTMGLCQYHYNKKRLEEKPERAKAGLRGHPFYSLWFERKQAEQLCDEWLDFSTFIIGISPKPEGNYFLLRKTNGLFGPDNFEWREHLERKRGESKKDWYARKWAARQAANPGMERARSLKRYYGFTVEQYDAIEKAQNGLCAICGQKETTFDGRTGTIRRLSVDHNHTTNKPRELLCWRCNGTIGRVEENTELLQSMIAYLNKHNGVNNV